MGRRLDPGQPRPAGQPAEFRLLGEQESASRRHADHPQSAE